MLTFIDIALSINKLGAEMTTFVFSTDVYRALSISMPDFCSPCSKGYQYIAYNSRDLIDDLLWPLLVCSSSRSIQDAR